MLTRDDGFHFGCITLGTTSCIDGGLFPYYITHSLFPDSWAAEFMQIFVRRNQVALAAQFIIVLIETALNHSDYKRMKISDTRARRLH